MSTSRSIWQVLIGGAALTMALAAGCSDSARNDDGGVADEGPADGQLDGALGDYKTPSDRQARLEGSRGDRASADLGPPPASWTLGKGGKLGNSLQTLTVDGQVRYFAVHTPPSYTGKLGVSLLLHFHGFRELPAGIEDELKYVWSPTADASGFIAVAPEGLPCPELNMGSNVACFQQDRDGKFVVALVTYLGTLYNIDLKRLYLSGHSGGSYFVQGFGLANPKTYAAAAEFSGGCVANTSYMNACSKYDQLSKSASRKLPFFIVHNKYDQIVPEQESVALLNLLKANGHPTNFIDTYNGGSTGHAINSSLVPQVWAWLAGFVLP